MINITRLINSHPWKCIYTQVRFAGHSKWQNIKHTKEANDQRKGNVAGKFAAAIKREAMNGADPKMNSNLGNLVAAALKAGVSKETINRNIERAKNTKFQMITVEMLGPNNCIILAQIEAENLAKARSEIKTQLKLNKSMGVQFMKEGQGLHQFDIRGTIKISKKDRNGQSVTFEKAEEIAIEAEAEEVEQQSSEDGDVDQDYWILRTETSGLFGVKSFIEKNYPEIEILDCDSEFIPKYLVEVPDNDIDKLASICSELESIEDVSKVFSNIK